MCTDHSGPFCTQVLPKTLLPNSPKRSLAEGKDGPSRPAAAPAFTAALLSAAPALQPPHIPSWPIPTHRSPVSLRSRQCLTPSPACSASTQQGAPWPTSLQPWLCSTVDRSWITQDGSICSRHSLLTHQLQNPLYSLLPSSTPLPTPLPTPQEENLLWTRKAI